MGITACLIGLYENLIRSRLSPLLERPDPKKELFDLFPDRKNQATSSNNFTLIPSSSKTTNMKFSLLSKALGVLGLIAALSTLVGVSGQKPAQPSTAKLTIAEIVAQSGGEYDTNPQDFDILLNALKQTGLTKALADKKANVTVFAPTDTAFLKLSRFFGYKGNDEAAVLGVISKEFAGLLADPKANLTLFAPTDTAFIKFARDTFGGADQGTKNLEDRTYTQIIDVIQQVDQVNTQKVFVGGDAVPLLQKVLQYYVSAGAKTDKEIRAASSVRNEVNARIELLDTVSRLEQTIGITLDTWKSALQNSKLLQIS